MDSLPLVSVNVHTKILEGVPVNSAHFLPYLSQVHLSRDMLSLSKHGVSVNKMASTAPERHTSNASLHPMS